MIVRILNNNIRPVGLYLKSDYNADPMSAALKLLLDSKFNVTHYLVLGPRDSISGLDEYMRLDNEGIYGIYEMDEEEIAYLMLERFIETI